MLLNRLSFLLRVLTLFMWRFFPACVVTCAVVKSAIEHRTRDQLRSAAEGFANAAIAFATMPTVSGVASPWSSVTYRIDDVRKAATSLREPSSLPSAASHRVSASCTSSAARALRVPLAQLTRRSPRAMAWLWSAEWRGTRLKARSGPSLRGGTPRFGAASSQSVRVLLVAHIATVRK